MLTYILNYHDKNPVEIYIDTDDIDRADAICENIISGSFDCYAHKDMICNNCGKLFNETDEYRCNC